MSGLACRPICRTGKKCVWRAKPGRCNLGLKLQLCPVCSRVRVTCARNPPPPGGCTRLNTLYPALPPLGLPFGCNSFVVGSTFSSPLELGSLRRLPRQGRKHFHTYRLFVQRRWLAGRSGSVASLDRSHVTRSCARDHSMSQFTNSDQPDGCKGRGEEAFLPWKAATLSETTQPHPRTAVGWPLQARATQLRMNMVDAERAWTAGYLATPRPLGLSSISPRYN